MGQQKITILLATLLSAFCSAIVWSDGLITKVPANGIWASFDVETVIESPDGKTRRSTGLLVIRTLDSEVIQGKTYRWLEIQHTWTELDVVPPLRKYHSSAVKFSFDEASLAGATNPLSTAIKAVSEKQSSDKPRDSWEFQTSRKLVAGKGSKTGFGAVDFYLRAKFDRHMELGNRDISIDRKNLTCIGLQTFERINNQQPFNVKLFEQWKSDESPFGVVEYQFEIISHTESSFFQKLSLKAWGEDSKSVFHGD